MYGPINIQDISIPIEELGLPNGKVYILMDLTEMSLTLPSGAIDASRNGLLVHEDVAHISLVTPSRMIDMLANMVGKLTGRGKLMSIHSSLQAAMDHLVKLANGQH
jgi:hypothetical protein